jgi:hypothetical protein
VSYYQWLFDWSCFWLRQNRYVTPPFLLVQFRENSRDIPVGLPPDFGGKRIS